VFSPRTETYVNVSSLSSPYNITVTKPTGTVDGDILFCWIGWYAAVTIDSVPAGWNLLGEYLVNTDRYALYYKIASGEGASWVWSFTATAKVRTVCSCYTSGDFNPLDPINVVSNTAYRTSGQPCRAASMTVATANSPLVFWGGVYSANSTRSFTKPSVPTTDWVEDDDYWNTTADFGVEVCSMIWGGSGATGVMEATISVTATTKHAFAVALKPPVATIDYRQLFFNDPCVDGFISITDGVKPHFICPNCHYESQGLKQAASDINELVIFQCPYCLKNIRLFVKTTGLALTVQRSDAEGVGGIP